MSHVLFAGGGTGGHLYPALALASALQEERVGTAVHFVGARRGVEAQVLPRLHVPHTLLNFEPLRRSRIWQNWRLLPSLISSMRGLSRLFRELHPRLVVGTGGYASAPACAFALLKGVPVALQEQNSWPGLTTRVMSRWARQVHLGFPEARARLRPGPRTEVSALGNPIRPPDTSLNRSACRAHFGLRLDATVVLVVGGSQGSRAINEALLGALALPASPGAQVDVLWATGPHHFDTISARLRTLEGVPFVKALPYIDDMPGALATADLAISRAGAMATAELLAWGIPSVLIPLPTAAADHQTHNARALAEAGAALLLPESGLTGARLLQELRRLVDDPALRSSMAAAARSRARPHAARDIARRLINLMEEAQ
jgi:UDP-N-acetylglucosamine--N-acetylmuramyl-(pentapeptide) pyrophosphoryl-undecaprenol N-acetylglucosamine transferase